MTGVLLVVGQARIHRQRQRPRRRPVGHRQVGMEAPLHDVRLAVDGDRVVDADADPGVAELRDDRVASRAHVDRVLVEDVGPPFRRHRQADRQVGEASS